MHINRLYRLLIIDKGEGNDDIINKRMAVVKSIQELDKLQSMEAAQKDKIKWAIEGDENFKYYHRILNKKRHQLSIRGVLANETWIDNPMLVKNEFYLTSKTGQWSDSNIDTIVHVLECFHRALCLRINMSKSRLMGIAMDVDRVEQAALKIGCAILKAPFSYLGTK
nr:RNA-directed DNA polymerase, eukaryota [Tanacetum cinerariifolium]